MSDRVGKLIARMIVAGTGAVAWHFGYHACAIGYFFFVILNHFGKIENSREKNDE